MSALPDPAAPALVLYERALSGLSPHPDASPVHHEAMPARVRFDDGSTRALPVGRYLAAADRSDRELLDGVAGPVLDVGCGPGRHLRALTGQGVYALGVDISPVAVELVRRAGAQAVVADVFGDVPGVGTWRTALLLDGNIGIGGCPARLLRRLRTLLVPDGVVLVELEAPGSATRGARARLESGELSSDWFPWARVSAAEIALVADRAGMALEREWRCEERWFAQLRA